MLRSAASKVMWVGRATVFLVGLAVIVGLVLGAASVALGANGGNFILGKNNTATLLTKLTGNVNGAALEVQNTDPGTNDTALVLNVQPDESPMRVDSTDKATNLNADYVDGKSFSCPDGTLFHEGVCIERTAQTFTPFDTANADCINDEGRLPTVAELQTFRNRSGQDFSGYEFTSEQELDGDRFVKIVQDGGGNVAYTPIGASWRYRCVFLPN